MRRQDRSIEDQAEQEQLILASQYMVLGMVDQGKPYTLPLNFGYEDGKVYFHSAREGRKIETLRQSGGQMPVSGVLVSHARLLQKGELACNLSTEYACVMFEGVAEEVTDTDEQMRGMQAILAHLGQQHRPLPVENLGRVCVVRITLHAVSAKKHLPE